MLGLTIKKVNLMLTLLNRFSKYSIVILGFLAITLSYAQEDRADDISILDVDASGEVDALTDGLLLLRSMFELTDDALVTGVVDSANCKECDAEGIDSYITSIKGTTYGGLTPEPDLLGHRGKKATREILGHKGRKATREILVLKEKKVIQVLWVHKVFREFKVIQVQQDLKEKQVPLETMQLLEER